MTFTPYLDVKVTSALRVELYDHVAHVRHKVIKQPDNGIWNADPTSNPDSKGVIGSEGIHAALRESQ